MAEQHLDRDPGKRHELTGLARLLDAAQMLASAITSAVHSITTRQPGIASFSDHLDAALASGSESYDVVLPNRKPAEVQFLGGHRIRVQSKTHPEPAELLVDSTRRYRAGGSEDVLLNFKIVAGPRSPFVETFEFPLRSDVNWRSNLAALADFVALQAEPKRSSPPPPVDTEWVARALDDRHRREVAG